MRTETVALTQRVAIVVVLALSGCDSSTQPQDPYRPKAGEQAVGICKPEDVSCGSYIEIKDGIAQEPYHID